jgi:geranylgeranyl pyrophosphate synthase
LFAGAAELGALAAGAGSHVSDATGRFGAAFGLVFQIYDDLLDLLATPGSTGKPTGEASHLTRPMRPLILLRDRAPAVALRDLAAAPRREVTLELLETYDVAADRLRYADAALADATAALDGLKSSVARQSLSALVAQARAACDAMLVVDGDAMAVTALP